MCIHSNINVKAQGNFQITDEDSLEESPIHIRTYLKLRIAGQIVLHRFPPLYFYWWISLFESLQNNGSHHCCHCISQLTWNVSFYHLYYSPLLVEWAYSFLILLIAGLTRHRTIQRNSNISVTARGKPDLEKIIHTKLLLLLGNESYVTLNLKLLLWMFGIEYCCI